MSYSDVSFIFFCSFVILFFSNIASSLRTLCLLLASAFWYFSWGKLAFKCFSAILIFDYFALLLFPKVKRLSRDQFFFILTSLNILTLIFLKLIPVLILDGSTPYGTSFFMLIILGMIIDCWREQKQFEKNDSIPILTMPIFFPLLMAGPIERTKYFFPQLKNSVFTFKNLSDGIIIFSIGFLKKTFISDVLLDGSFKNISGNFLLDGLVDIFITYIILSSYCEMGRGVAKVFGINLTVNFRAFYYSKNPNDFWQRWNITLGTWIRDYVTFPLMFKWGRKISPNLIIVFSFLLVGLWHGLTFNWVVFGLFNGLIIYLYNVLNKKLSSSIHGYFLAICLWIGIGIFQHEDFLTRIKAPFKLMPSYDFSIINTSMLAVALLIFFIFEFIQEKKKDPDFYLKWSSSVKYTLSILLVIWFIYALKMNYFIEIEELPPMYFRF